MFIEIAEDCVRGIIHDLYAAADTIEELVKQAPSSKHSWNGLKVYSSLRGSANWLTYQRDKQLNKDGQQEFENSR